MNRIYFFSTILTLFIVFSCKEDVKPAMKPLEVMVTPVIQEDVNLESTFTGQTYGQSDIQINSRVNGLILSLNFKEGSMVTKGQLLYTIDPLPYQENVNIAQAGYAETEARLAKAKSDLDMIEPLAKINAVSQRELIAAKSAYKANLANLKASAASLENSKIELGYARIVAPISGLIGISKYRVGDYVQQGGFTVLNTVSDVGNIRVRFTMSEQEYLRIFREVQKGNLGLKKASESISLILSDGSLYPETGTLSFTDRQVEPTTGAVTFEAAFTNPDRLLRPGQFVKINVVTDIRKDALIIPQRAVIEMQGIYQVFVVDKNNKVQMKIIQVGGSFKDAYIVSDGLTANDTIVMGGTSLLKNGSPITPKVSNWKPGQSTTNILNK